MDKTKIAVRGSTQDYLEIADIRDDLVLLKDGSVSLVLQVAAVNFSLLSEREQEAIIFAYAEFLNSLNFAIQIVIRSQKKDLSSYLSLLEKSEAEQANPQLKEQIAKYRAFAAQMVKENNVLDKKFYLVIPSAETILEKAKIALSPKRDHTLRQLSRLGLKARQMTTNELINLFYEIYNSS